MLQIVTEILPEVKRPQFLSFIKSTLVNPIEVHTTSDLLQSILPRIIPINTLIEITRATLRTS